MAKASPTRRLASLLRRSAAAPPPPAEEGAAWSSQSVAAVKSREAAEAAQTLTAHAAKQRAAADILTDRAHSVGTRAQELAAGFGRVQDSFERLALVALNAGLEGARLGEQTGKSLLLVSDEVRAHVARGSEGARELTSTLNDVAADVAKLQAQIEAVRQGAQDVSQEAARVAGAAGEVERAVTQLGERLSAATGSSPEAARVLAEAGEHAKALVAALSALGGDVHPRLVVAALRPVLGPLARVLGDPKAYTDEDAR